MIIFKFNTIINILSVEIIIVVNKFIKYINSHLKTNLINLDIN